MAFWKKNYLKNVAYFLFKESIQVFISHGVYLITSINIFRSKNIALDLVELHTFWRKTFLIKNRGSIFRAKCLRQKSTIGRNAAHETFWMINEQVQILRIHRRQCLGWVSNQHARVSDCSESSQSFAVIHIHSENLLRKSQSLNFD